MLPLWDTQPATKKKIAYFSDLGALQASLLSLIFPALLSASSPLLKLTRAHFYESKKTALRRVCRLSGHSDVNTHVFLISPWRSIWSESESCLSPLAYAHSYKSWLSISLLVCIYLTIPSSVAYCFDGLSRWLLRKGA